MEVSRQFAEIYELIASARERVFRAVNAELIELYWQIGRYISGRVDEAVWGKGVVENLASFLKEREPDLRGFSARNLWRMKQFYEEYRDSPKLSTLLTEIPWSSHLN
jgi:predicted nuclease of restriction endonuclease-like (RecB) superfamily